MELYVSFSLRLHGLHRNSAACASIQKRSEAVELTKFLLNCTVAATPSAGFSWICLMSTRMMVYLAYYRPVFLNRWTAARNRAGPWHQLYRAARGSPGICHFSFLSNFQEYMFYSGNILEEKNIRECVEKLRPRCWPEETKICYKISLVLWLITNLNVILCLSTCHTV